MAQRSGFAFGGDRFSHPDAAAEAPRWRKASASGDTGCVEVAGVVGNSVLVRDSKDVEGPVVVMTREAFAGLVAGIRGRVG
ncbi:MAG TPA: DUF397 domain-containing protein [Spirillospora sp.]|nr:DUF397 domain-containing protein [Spirillospora sp.]